MYLLTRALRLTTRMPAECRCLARRSITVLGIETTCDDTCAAVVTSEGQILGEANRSQSSIHTELGGIIPPVARDLHKKNIGQVVDAALEQSNLTLEEVDVVATSVKPGLSLSLGVGLDYTKQLIHKYQKQFIPIHHMEAHALVTRLTNSEVQFPYLCLLASGAHCQLVVVVSSTEFHRLGTCLDDAPGEVFDKVARRLRLKSVPECRGLSGGASIERMAHEVYPTRLTHVMIRYRDCHFSFAGLKASALKSIELDEQKFGLVGGGVLPTAKEICANLQTSMLLHILNRVERALIYCQVKQIIPQTSSFVVAGGVASNTFFRSGLEKLCEEYSATLVAPPIKYCTDNAVMVAWNGVEMYNAGVDIVRPEDIDGVEFEPSCELGVDVSEEVKSFNIKGLKSKRFIIAST